MTGRSIKRTCVSVITGMMAAVMLCVNTFAATTNTKQTGETIVCDKTACDSFDASAGSGTNYHLKEFVKTLGTVNIGSRDAVLYSKPSIKSKKIAVIPSHEPLPIRSINYDLWWCRVQYGKWRIEIRMT